MGCLGSSMYRQFYNKAGICSCSFDMLSTTTQSTTREKSGRTFTFPSMSFPSTHLQISISALILSHHCFLLANTEATQIFLKWYNMCIKAQKKKPCSFKHSSATERSNTAGTTFNTHTHPAFTLFLFMTAVNVSRHGIWAQKLWSNENLWSLIT